MIFLSLGAGVQSSVMLMRAIEGDIERPDHVIFSDTGWEPAAVYEHVDWCERQCWAADIPFHRVGRSVGIRKQFEMARIKKDGRRFVVMPFYVDDGQNVAMLRRQCTREFKIDPIRKKQRELLGYKAKQRIPEGSAGTMIGISTDEARRAGASRERWVDNLYPLIDPLRMSRADCQAWWEAKFPHRPLVKSSCIGCPYHSDAEWSHMQRQAPDEFENACRFDEEMRDPDDPTQKDLRGKRYLHRSCRPLREIDFGAAQLGLNLEDEIYCAGGCGL